MFPTYLIRSQIDDLAWNETINLSRQCVSYGFTFYLDMVCEDWHALVWPAGGEYRIVMPIPVRRKWGLQIPYQPILCQYLGIFSRNPLEPAEAGAFLSAFEKRFCYISAYHFNPDNFSVLERGRQNACTLHFRQLKTHWIDLHGDYASIAGRYSKDRAANLKRAMKHGWIKLRSSNIHPLIYLFVNYQARNIPTRISGTAYELLENIFVRLLASRNAELWYAHRDGVIHAGVFIIRHGERAIYLFNAADECGRKGNARTFLLDCYFKEHAGQQLLFDFESPPVESIASHYRSFGSVEMPFYQVSKNALPFPFRQVQNWRKSLLVKTR